MDWSKRGTPDFEADLIVKYLPLANWLASNYIHRSTQVRDDATIYSAAQFGLLKAIRRYAPDKGVRFSTYAGLRIMGEMKDAVRKNDATSRLSRQRIRRQHNAEQLLAQKLGRKPTDEELQQQLGTSVLRERKSVQLDTSRHDRPQHKRAARMTHEQTEAFREITSGLNLVEQTILFLLYWREATMFDVGAILGISESRVSQINAQLMVRLRDNPTTRDKLVSAIPKK